MMEHLTAAIWAAFGSLAVNLLQLLEAHHLPPDKRPNFKDPLYWTALLVWPLLAGGLAFAYSSSEHQLKPLLAINVGASAPLILRSLASAVPTLGRQG